MRNIRLFDTTLRDGEKAPGTILTVQEKFRIAKSLERLNVDVIEAGFPAASKEQYETVERISGGIRKPVIAALARATNAKDFEIAWEALKNAESPRLHTFVPASRAYRKHFLDKDIEQLIELTRAAVKMAAGYTADVEFSLVDALRADPRELVQVIEAAIAAGATTINIADTVGYATPVEVGSLFDLLRQRIDDFDRVVFSVHCHNDLGMAVANSLVAVEHGASQIHCTLVGIGERAGNAALEEIAVTLAARSDHYEAQTRVELQQIYPACRLAQRLMGTSPQPNKPVVGANAFAFDDEVPQLADATEPPPYKIVEPAIIGWQEESHELSVTTPFEGFCQRVTELGFQLSESELRDVYARFQQWAEERDTIPDTDLELLLNDKVDRRLSRYKLLYLNVSAGTISVPNATVQMEIDGQNYQDAGFGQGPVDATFKTIFKMVKRSPRLLRYEVKAITSGSEALGEVCVRLEEDGRLVQGRAVDTDIVLASAKALVDGLNKLEYSQSKPSVSEFTDEESWITLL